jgi:hypothetical protein
MYNEAGDLQQEEELPTYNYLEEQESSNPNSRYVVLVARVPEL